MCLCMCWTMASVPCYVVHDETTRKNEMPCTTAYQRQPKQAPVQTPRIGGHTAPAAPPGRGQGGWVLGLLGHAGRPPRGWPEDWCHSPRGAAGTYRLEVCMCCVRDVYWCCVGHQCAGHRNRGASSTSQQYVLCSGARGWETKRPSVEHHRVQGEVGNERLGGVRDASAAVSTGAHYC